MTEPPKTRLDQSPTFESKPERASVAGSRSPQLKPASLKPGQTKPLPKMEVAAPVDAYQLALKLLEQGQIAEAIHHLQDKLAAEPNFAPAHCLLGRAHANLGQWSEARRWCQSAVTLDSLLPEAYYMLSLIYQQENNLTTAIVMLKKAIYLNRNHSLYHFNLAILYQKVNDQLLMQRTLENTLRLLAAHAPADILPDAEGVTAGHLRQVVEKMLNKAR